MGICERVNNVRVSIEDLCLVHDEAETLTGGGDAFKHMPLAMLTELFHGDPSKTSAIYFRMNALSSLLNDTDASGNHSPHAGEGAIDANDIALATAARQPLIQVGNELVFDRDEFMAACAALY